MPQITFQLIPGELGLIQRWAQITFLIFQRCVDSFRPLNYLVSWFYWLIPWYPLSNITFKILGVYLFLRAELILLEIMTPFHSIMNYVSNNKVNDLCNHVSQLSESNMHIFMQNLAGKRQVLAIHIYMVIRF